MKIKSSKLFDVVQWVIICDKMSTASYLFDELVNLYDPLDIKFINRQALVIDTTNEYIIFTRNDEKTFRGRHNCLFLSPNEYREFADKYENERMKQIHSMSFLQKKIYNHKLRKHFRVCPSMKEFNIKNCYL